MDENTRVTILWGEANEDGFRNSWRYSGSTIPTVGSHFSAWSQRDTDGNYMNESILGNKGRPIISGRVTDVQYHWSGRGRRHSWTEQMFVYITIEADDEYQTTIICAG